MNTRFTFFCIHRFLLLFIFFAVVSCKGQSGENAGVAESSSSRTDGTVSVRQPQVAGTFYPADLAVLRTQIDGYLGEEIPIGIPGIHALLVPHAGLRYSASTAASGFREVSRDFDRVIILGSNHSREAAYSGISVTSHTHYAIGGADIPVSMKMLAKLKEALPDLVTHDPAAHTTHVLEIEMPFLQARKGWPEEPDYEVLPLVLSGLSANDCMRVATVLRSMLTARTLLVVSSDLSHYQEDQRARKLDGMTLNAVLAGEVDRINSQFCCGPDGIRILLHLAGMQGWQSNFLKYANSGDTTGDKSQVVGYGCIVFSDPIQFTGLQKSAILEYAERVVSAAARGMTPAAMSGDELKKNPVFRLRRGVFVTIEKNHRLRGCIGNLMSVDPLHLGILRNGLNAALKDHRFTPLREEELEAVEVKVSVLTHPRQQSWRPDEYTSKLRPGVDGVILICNGKQSTYLPSVWEMLPDVEQFLSQLALKQGSSADAWKQPGTVIYTYQATEVKR